MNLGPYKEDPLANNVIPLCILPIISILCFIFYPDSNGTAIFIGSIFIVMMVAVSVIIKIKKWQYYLGARLGGMALFLDCTALFLALTISRMYNNATPAIMLILFLAISIILGHKYAKPILSEVNSPQTRIGKFILFLGFFGSGIGSLVGYWSVKTIGAHIAAPVSFMLILIGVVMVHANFHQVAFDKE
ncbi:hypothetical protein BGM26_20855 [Bacillus sp. FJAT-29790]|uniref:hypothetical protein n=1 Tax=Bacillus sp. FJAT-29790 TaxID=1895002 RepID=UPI001C227B58|nr:hypothetical protein [Bacillus sp. FJAT-29790]MBU8881373.1 hypothetical protein [Bacillus sp. FJAT-29790]